MLTPHNHYPILPDTPRYSPILPGVEPQHAAVTADGINWATATASLACLDPKVQTATRRRLLKEHYNFVCTCAACGPSQVATPVSVS